MRPPVGKLDHRVVQVAAELGFRHIVLWSLNSNDWSRASVSSGQIVDTVCSCAAPGGITLLHDGPPPERKWECCQPTVDAVAQILPALRGQGYELVSVSDLLAWE
jgi:peptidoglycan-N-acetylglucosamine deacetylase